MSKAVQKTKSRKRGADEVLGLAPDFWNWGDESAGPMVLHDHPAEPVRDLMERTALFGEAIVRFSKKVPHTVENTRLISQLVGAGTSIGANYCEADDSVSGKDFKKSIGTCRKESLMASKAHIRISGFGFVSNFGFRNSDLEEHLCF